MREIILIHGQKVQVDDEDYDRLIGPRWFCSNRKGLLYARRNIKGQLNKKILMHREILGLTNPKIYVDHLDGNGLNNQRSNLRICNQFGNMANRTKNKNSTSKFKGVSLSRTENKFIAKIAGRHIGRYDSEIEAALAYNCAASFAFREFARLNVIPV